MRGELFHPTRVSIFHYDFETRSSVSLSKYGAARYASDESTAILLCAVCKDDGPIELFDATADAWDNMPALMLLKEAAEDPDAVLFAHNINFELMITHYLWKSTFGFDPPAPEKMRCTAALCRVAAIPQGLDAAAQYLKLDVEKDALGKALIKKFSIPQKVRGREDTYWIDRNYPKPLVVDKQKMSSAEAWNHFRNYCIKDVEVERQLHKRLKPLELTGWVLDAFRLDMRMNLRGVPINLDAIAKAREIIAGIEEEVGGEFTEITGLNPTQGAKVLAWLKERGYPRNDLTISSVTEVLTGEQVDEETGEATGEVSAPATSGMTPEAVRALTLKSLIGYAALKKLPTMENAVCPDGRLRGMFLFWGAIRTGRYSSKIVQLQNLKRPTTESEELFRLIQAGGVDAKQIEMLYGSPLANIAAGIRHYIGFSDGGQIMGADFSQIEARALPWLAGHTELLDAFRRGEDLYKVTIAGAMGKTLEEVSKDERQLGKALTLACGYSGGISAMDSACDIYGIELPSKEKRKLVKAWRKANQPIVKLWKLVSDAAVEAILNPGSWFQATSNVRFGVTRELGFPSLVMEMPSGRRLFYPEPQATEVYKIKRPRKGVKPEDLEEGEELLEWVSIPRYQAIGPDNVPFKGVWVTYEMSYFGPGKHSVVWGRTRTHGGVFVENLTQATAGDFLTLGALNAEKRGFDQILTVHDEIAAEYHPERGNTVEGLVKAMCELPSWAKEFPLAAVGEIQDFYSK